MRLFNTIIMKEEDGVLGKDLEGNELGKGIGQRKDGRYEYRKTINGQKISFYSFDLDEIICFKDNINLKIRNGENFNVKTGKGTYKENTKIVLDEITQLKECKRLKKN